jgi:amino acid permease
VVVDLIIIGFALFGAVVYNYSYGRMLFVSGLDRRLPSVMSKVNAARVPWVAVLVQSIIVVVLDIAVYMVIPYTVGGIKPADLATVSYNVLLAAITLIWCLSMIFLFIDVIVIRYKYHEAFTGARLAPDWVFYLLSVLGLLANGIGLYATVSAPWVPSLIDFVRWDAWIISLVVVSLVAATVIYYVGHARIRADVTDEEAIAKATGGVAGE